MKLLWTAAKIVGVILTVAYVAVSWVEANREIRILCGSFEPGQRLSDVVTTLDTGEYLRYRIDLVGDAREIRVSSFYNGLDSACTVSLSDGTVTASVHRTRAQAYVLFGKD